MRIVRFIDEDGQQRFGRNFEKDTATLLEGDLLTGLTETDKVCHVKKLLAPLVPAAIFGIGLNYHQHAEEIGRHGGPEISGRIHEKSGLDCQPRGSHCPAGHVHGSP